VNYFFKIAKFISLGFIVLVSITLLFLFFANKSENNIHKINDSFILETLPKVFKLYDLDLDISEEEILFSLYRESKPSPKNMLYINKIDDIIINLETYDKNKNIFESKFKELESQPNFANKELLCEHLDSYELGKTICPIKINEKFFNFKHNEDVESSDGVKDIFSIDYNISRINKNYYWINITASSPTFF
tara:strand:- start:57 stop:629 length:573 start_codon:yes stop_codon:yes gene_type:complete